MTSSNEFQLSSLRSFLLCLTNGAFSLISARQPCLKSFDYPAMTSDNQMHAALSVMRRMPPTKLEYYLGALIEMVPNIAEDLLQRVDQPLHIMTDPDSGLEFLLCEYNRDDDSFRSPWNNKYYPPLEDGFKPSVELRLLEEKFNSVFSSYKSQYYEGGVSSVYLWDLEEPGSFAGSFLIKKVVNETNRRVSGGCWDSIHIIEAIPSDGTTFEQGTYTYKLSTTVILTMNTTEVSGGTVNLSGNLSRQAKNLTLEVNSDGDHIVNIGKMIEDMEIDLRNALDGLYVQKTREIMHSIRSPTNKVVSGHNFVTDLENTLRSLKKSAD